MGAVEPAPLEPPAESEPAGRGSSGRSTTIGGSSRFVPGSHQNVTVVNGKIQLGQRLVDLWRNRDLLLLLTRTELKVKYKNSVLGYLWSMLNPALVLAVYYVVFKTVGKNHQPNFAVFLFCGLLVWNLFNNAAMSSTGVVVANSGIVKKVAFPRELLALSTVGVALVLFFLQVVVLLIALLAFGIVPSWDYLPLLPLALIALLMFTSAVSIFLSAVNVYLRDTQHLTEVLLMAWFWSIPVVYAYGQVSSELTKHGLTPLKYVFMADPITPIVLTFQRSIYGVTSYMDGGTLEHVLPYWGVGTYALLMALVIGISTGLFLLALVVFGRLEGNFAEEL